MADETSGSLLDGANETQDTQQTPPASQAQGSGSQTQGETQAPQYEPFSIPTGLEVTSQDIEDFGKFAAEQGMSQEQAQSVINYVGRYSGDGAEAARLEIIRRATEKRSGEWREMAEADPFIKQNLSYGKKTMAQFGNDPELQKLISEEGIGNNPAFVRFCINIGRALGEAPFIENKSANPRPEHVNPLLALAKTYQN